MNCHGLKLTLKVRSDRVKANRERKKLTVNEKSQQQRIKEFRAKRMRRKEGKKYDNKRKFPSFKGAKICQGYSAHWTNL